jgi:transcriptional regulator with XRE-family HTH domain
MAGSRIRAMLTAMKKRPASDEAILRAIGGEFAACRRERGFSQEDLAEIARVSADKVSVIERGRRDFGMLAISGLYLLLECGGIIVEAECFVPLRDRPIGLRVLRETTGVRARRCAKRERRDA